jgi:2-keto-myo-inositol isomerase
MSGSNKGQWLKMIPCYNGATSRPYSLAEDISAASAAGFPMIELWGEKFDAFFQEHTVDDLKQLLQRHNLRAAAIDLVALDYSAPENVQKAVERACTLGKIAQAVGCDLLLLCSWGDLQGRSKEEGIALVAEYLRPVCAAAAEFGCRLAIEPLGGHALIPGCSEALAIIDQAQQPNLGLMWDFFHYHKSGVPLETVRRIPVEKLWLVHVDDAPDLSRETLRDPDRVYPGQGALPLADYFQILHELGYRGPVSVELFNQTYYHQPIETITRDAYQSLHTFLA